MPEKHPLPPVCPPQVRVVGRYCVLLPFARADNERVVGLHGNDPPELLDRVGVGIAVGCGLDVFGVRTRMQGAFLLSVHNHVTGPKTTGHALGPFQLLHGLHAPGQQRIKPGMELLLERRSEPIHKLSVHLLEACSRRRLVHRLFYWPLA